MNYGTVVQQIAFKILNLTMLGATPTSTTNMTPKQFSEEGPQEYIPEMWTIKKDYICAAIDSIKAGIEYAEIVLTDHERLNGRATRKNRVWAEQMERDIKNMTQALEQLQLK